MTTQARQVATYLESLGDHIHSVRPVSVTIGKVTYQGAEYGQTHFPEGLRIFLVGELPKCYARRPNGTCFKFQDDSHDWYICCYADDKAVREKSEFHPFGRTFILSPWSVPSGEAIDRYELKPYDRVPAILNLVSQFRLIG